jgi:uncharacterized protein (DUF58 family)
MNDERTALLDPELVRTLDLLRRHLEVRARSSAAGEQSARRRGGAAEFEEHRPYVSGDDLRRLDWLAYARTGEPVLKLFRAEEDAIVRVVLDASASMAYGEPTKYRTAQRLAAAIAYLSLTSGQRVQSIVLGGKLGTDDQAPHQRSIGAVRRGRAAFGAVVRELSARGPARSLSLEHALDELLVACRKPGALVVMSDFLCPSAATRALGHLAAKGHDVALVQILAPDELEPEAEGDLTLIDSETGAAVDVTLDAAAHAAYRERLSSLVATLRVWARRHAASFLFSRSDEPTDQVVRRFVARAID